MVHNVRHDRHTSAAHIAIQFRVEAFNLFNKPRRGYVAAGRNQNTRLIPSGGIGSRFNRSSTSVVV